MTEPTSSSICPWCSADVPAGRDTCPACGANLIQAADPAVPGLTSIDPQAVIRNVRATASPPRRSRLLSLITGDDADEAAAVTGTPTALAPPPLDVRREMLRMEIEAELTNARAEVEALVADEAVERDEPLPASVADDPAVTGAGADANGTNGSHVPADDPANDQAPAPSSGPA